MRLLLDNCVDIRFAALLQGLELVHASVLGWGALSNGNLLAAAEEAGFTHLVTVDKNIRHQQNFSKRSIGLITLNPQFTELQFIAPLAGQILELARAGTRVGSVVLVPENHEE